MNATSNMALLSAQGLTSRIAVLYPQLIVTAALCWAPLAQAQTTPPPDPTKPANDYSYSRTSSFQYRADGLLIGETVEPDIAALCVNTSYDYDETGNKRTVTTGNCPAAPGGSVFAPRTSNVRYESQSVSVAGVSGVVLPAGSQATWASNAATHTETRTFDPRFGTPLTLTGPNGLVTSWVYDAFGRVTSELRADGTHTDTYYCFLDFSGVDHSSDTPGCPGPETPGVPGAVRYEHTAARDAAGAPIGPFTQVYFDAAGRKIRTVTEAFDGSLQAGGSNQRIVQDTTYNAFGGVVLRTQPYFYGTASSVPLGAGDVGLTLIEYDALGRAIHTYSADVASDNAAGGQHVAAFGSYGSRAAALTEVAYNGLSTTTTDDLGRTRTEVKNPIGEVVLVTDADGAQLVHQRDAFGNLLATKDALQNQIEISYDIRGRKLVMDDPNAGVTAYCYDALGQLKAQQTSAMRGSHFIPPAATCPAGGATGWTTFAYDVLGRMTQRVDPEYSSSWSYDAKSDGTACGKSVGKLCEARTSHGITRRMVYDALGRPVSSRTDIAGGPSMAQSQHYDSAGRIDQRVYPTGVRVLYTYTSKGFPESLVLDTEAAVPAGTGPSVPRGTVLWQAKSLNAWGQLELGWYGNGFINGARFDPTTGRLVALNSHGDIGPGFSAAAARKTAANAKQGTAVPLVTVIGHDITVVDQDLFWDSVGQLMKRTDRVGDPVAHIEATDKYSYDRIGRLIHYEVSGGTTGSPSTRSVDLTYNALGMMLTKTDVGGYSYPAQGVAHGLPQGLRNVSGDVNTDFTYDLNGNAVTATGGKYSNIKYTSFNLPDDSTGLQGSAASYRWQYDENHARVRQSHSVGGATTTTWFLHPDNQGGLGFEREVSPSGVASNRHFLTVGGQTIGVLSTPGALPTLTADQTVPVALTTIAATRMEYWHKDHLGSLLATTLQKGGAIGYYSYDPFGKRRYASTTYDAFGDLVVDWTTDTPRGFTGHEHLDDVGVVHMNGRVFDPTLGRFLQADPFIQNPLNLQNFDRYGYCYNSPLTCTDPSGQLFGIDDLFIAVYVVAAARATNIIDTKTARSLIGIAVAIYLGPSGTFFAESGAAYGVSQAAIAGFVSGAVSSGNINGALQGSFSSVLFYGVGQAIAETGGSGVGLDGSIADGAQFAKAVALHGVAGCVSSVVGGGRCGSGSLSAAFSKAVTPFTGQLDRSGNEVAGTIVSAVVGGTGSVLGGGKFANGATTGAFSYLFNNLATKIGARLLLWRASRAAIFAEEYLAAEAGLSGMAASRAYASHADFVKAFGPAGAGREWHHIVEQYGENLARFGSEAIHNPSNYVNVTKELHIEITRYYNSMDPVAGKLVRDVVAEMSFAQQREFGVQVIKGLALSEQFRRGFEGAVKWLKALGN